MRTYGYGGRGDRNRDDESVLAGVLSTDVVATGEHTRLCANQRCMRPFVARQDGDLYCSEACDLDDNPHLKGKGRNCD